MKMITLSSLASAITLTLLTSASFAAGLPDVKLSPNSCVGLFKSSQRGQLMMLKPVSMEIGKPKGRVSEVTLSYNNLTFNGEISFGGGVLAQLSAEYIGSSGFRSQIVSDSVDLMIDRESKVLAIEGTGGGGTEVTILLECVNPIYVSAPN